MPLWTTTILALYNDSHLHQAPASILAVAIPIATYYYFSLFYRGVWSTGLQNIFSMVLLKTLGASA